jgi:gas vesicle protein
MTEWHRQASRVYGKGQSYNCHNNVTAETLQNTLNNYETRIGELQSQIQTNTNLNKIRQQLIALQMDITQIQNDLDKIKELVK